MKINDKEYASTDEIIEMGHQLNFKTGKNTCLKCGTEFVKIGMTFSINDKVYFNNKDLFRNNSGYEYKIQKCSEVIMRKALK